MKTIKMFQIIFVCISVVFSQEYCQLGKRLFVSVVDSFPQHDLDILNKIGKTYGMTPLLKLDHNFKLGLLNRKASFGFAYMELTVPTEHLSSSLRDSFSTKIIGDSANICSFDILASSSKNTNKKLFQCLTSAYAQEVNPDIRNDDSMYFNLKEKSKKELKIKTLIWPVLGMRYLYTDNPFEKNSSSLEVLETLEELLFLSGIIIPFAFDAPQKFKIALPILGLTGLIEFRLLSYWGLTTDLNGYNAIRNSGYRVPKSIQGF